MTHNKMQKWFIIILIFLSFGLFFSVDVAINASEDLTINGEDVEYYNTDETITIPSEDEYEYNMFEFRGMWVATVWNGDFRTATTVKSFKNQFTKILDTLEANNFNTIFFQIRPSNDAFYVSELNP